MVAAAFAGLPLLLLVPSLAGLDVYRGISTGTALALWYGWFVVGLVVAISNARSYARLRQRCWEKETLPDRARERAFGVRVPEVNIVDVRGKSPTGARDLAEGALQGLNQVWDWAWRNPVGTPASIALRFALAGGSFLMWIGLMIAGHALSGILSAAAGLIMVLAGVGAIRARERHHSELEPMERASEATGTD